MVSGTGIGFSSFGLTVGAVDELVRLAFLASSAAKVERTEVIICWEWVEAASLSATSAAMAAAVFLDSTGVEDGPFDSDLDGGSGFDSGTVGSLLSRLLMFAACSSCPCATCHLESVFVSRTETE